jgi:hypothetical protein
MRQQNVQQQNIAATEEIRRCAKYWRNSVLPPALKEAAAARGVDCEKVIFLKLEIDFPGMPRLFGTLLTSDERFIEFEIETDETHSKVELIETWQDTTDAQNTSPHNRGFGVGTGALAIQVLHEINCDA